MLWDYHVIKYMQSATNILFKLKGSVLAKDSFWSVFGNGVGNFFLLMGGVLIARLLGKDLYGEYGMVKTTMFYIAGFASFGLSYSSTKFIAEKLNETKEAINAVIFSSLKIALSFSILLCVLLFLFSHQIALFVEEPRLALPFKYLGVIIVLRALANTLNGLLGGFKQYKRIGINSIISGSTLFILGAIFTYIWGIIGSFAALMSSQLVLCVLNSFVLRNESKKYPSKGSDYTNAILKFSLPVAIQELFFVICNWGVMLVLTKYATLGDVGIYSAAAQWYAVVLFIPTLLSNVVLSYLSSINKDKKHYERLFNKLLLINIICSIIPCFFVFLFSGVISSFYGNEFEELQGVLNILILGTVFACAAGVCQSDYLARNKNWLLAFIRLIRDALILSSLYIALRHDAANAAYKLAVINTSVYFVYFMMLFVSKRIS